MRRNLREALVWSQPYDFLQRRRSAYAGQYARLFPDLPPLDCAEDLLYALGGSGGLADAPGTVDASGAAGWPLFGQFIAHDITADRSPLGKRADASLIRNFRTPRANLEPLYDAGTGTPFLYDRYDPARFLIGHPPVRFSNAPRVFASSQRSC